MFMSKATYENPELQKRIDQIIEYLDSHQPDTEEYSKAVLQLKELYDLKELDKPMRVSPDALISTAGMLGGILIIVGFEKSNVFTSKALSLLRKP